ncbi:hypothetical protein [Litoribrevibacter albus]|uniref:Uncharacterized protein n=1 Tax=Litoribrevibacter albus TaxID=1473156 RepID=A0AA37S976_9GAMM|nr:hypothetical protein [Litoribrevibacter albus]GLQ30437.1 hypothetical protein GCM10007876_09150 [Litoribrevibacter albus]
MSYLTLIQRRLIQLLCLLIISLPMSALAGKPTDENGIYLGNGFPSGPHFNLIIHGKKLSFNCPDPQFYYLVVEDNNGDGDAGAMVKSCDDGDVCALTNEQYYGNVIFLPRDGRNVQIQFESGRKGPKSNPDATTLEVTDWCTKPFDSDAANVRLPKDPDGYAVYARVTGKPTEGSFSIFGRSFTLVETEDDNGNISDLLFLGVVTETGVFVGVELEPVTATGGKGKNKATEITSIFEFTGQVCYTSETDPACDEGGCFSQTYCCPPDGSEACQIVPEGEDPALFCPTLGDGTWEATEFFCHEYEDDWIFNIADFVNVLFDVKNDDTYNIQIRFYPLPLQ